MNTNAPRRATGPANPPVMLKRRPLIAGLTSVCRTRGRGDLQPMMAPLERSAPKFPGVGIEAVKLSDATRLNRSGGRSAPRLLQHQPARGHVGQEQRLQHLDAAMAATQDA